MIYDRRYFYEWHRINIEKKKKRMKKVDWLLLKPHAVSIYTIASCQFSNKIENNDAEKEKRAKKKI